ncbi:response regulator transcription factor [Alkalicaulis satelles]|uniref:Response regulator transcription factor n=1 Tax=Alkalicaulis satelles TaxID=2609175 RepID=A0A5M6ZJV8_9PROT|nr:response regulator transcription factor [Alkalicaulis satelles]KAA5803518.1 response regulator transcription factor [Alkalicaulis satelles]
MARITLIDDDPVEALILRELLAHGGAGHELVHHTRLEDFTTAPVADLVLLDRRVPPHDDFASSLPALEASGYAGPVLLISAAPEGVSAGSDVLTLTGPVSKSDLLEPAAVARAIEAALAAGG